MFAKYAQKLTGNLIKNMVISESDAEVYRFGFEAGFAIIANVLVTLIVGFILGMPLESLLLLAVFIPLRSCAGGIHASNNIKCTVLSALAVFSSLIAAHIAVSYLNAVVVLIAGVACSAIILALAPVQDANRPLDKAETRLLKQRTLKVLCAEITILILLLSFGLKAAALVLVCTLCLVCLSICVGALKNHLCARGIKGS